MKGEENGEGREKGKGGVAQGGAAAMRVSCTHMRLAQPSWRHALHACLLLICGFCELGRDVCIQERGWGEEGRG